jgi:chloramphenicol-sensitive protein RarD
LAFSFGGYGLVRKLAHVGPLVGVAVETAMLVPIAAAYVALAHTTGRTAPLDGSTFFLLSISGVVTAVPLLWFTAATRRLRLSTMGFLQYVGPTCQFLLAVFAYGEQFSAATLGGFALIWSACVIYSIDSVRAYRAATSPAQPVTEM